MTDPRKQLTEEIPESPKDFSDRRLTEVGGEIVADKRKSLTETEPVEEDEDGGRGLLLG
jgi:hypothetical protein